MTFEVYIPKPKKGENGPKATVKLSNASIVLNKLARGKMKASHLELAFDPEQRVIRIQPAGPDSKSKLELKKTKVYAKGFFKHFGIEAQGKFEAHYDEAENAIYVQI